MKAKQKKKNPKSDNTESDIQISGQRILEIAAVIKTLWQKGWRRLRENDTGKYLCIKGTPWH